MGFLDNTSVTVDAILTKKGRELLSAGSTNFNITQFAVGDDEVDYTLWNSNHPNGSDYYGTVIANMPLLEAFPDETQALRYKLITLPRNTAYLPAVSVTTTNYAFNNVNASQIITPITTNVQNGNVNLGYTAILSDARWFDLQVVNAVANSASIPVFVGDVQSNQSISRVGTSFRIMPKAPLPTVSEGTKTATITIIGNETGGQVTITLRVSPQVSSNQQSLGG